MPEGTFEVAKPELGLQVKVEPVGGGLHVALADYKIAEMFLGRAVEGIIRKERG